MDGAVFPNEIISAHLCLCTTAATVEIQYV